MTCFKVFVILLAARVNAEYQPFEFTQMVDHFNAQCTKTFSQRYYIDDSNWRPGGPIFHFLGGESPIAMAQLSSLYPFASQQLARSLHAMVLVTEHRYFGESLPFGPESSFSLSDGGCSGGMGLLNVEQALRDFIAIAEFVKSSRCHGCPVVAMGGSYPGLLAAMIRVRYPDDVHASVAASAPLGFLAGKVDPYGWFRIVTEAASASHAKCPAAVRLMFAAIQDADAADLVGTLRVCKEGLSDAELRHEAIAVARTELATLAMGNYPPRTSPFADMCGRLVEAAFSSRGGLGAASVLLHRNDGSSNSSQKTCRSFQVERPAGRAASVDCIDRTGCSGGRAGQAWDYMGCTWLRIPIATNNVTDMFPPQHWSKDWVSGYCARRFEILPTPELLPRRFGFEEPGHLRSVASRIIFTNGLRDGWSAGGILESMGEDLPALVMPNGAHHSEMNLPSADDTEDVIAVRSDIEQHLSRWLASSSSPQTIEDIAYGTPPTYFSTPLKSASGITILSVFGCGVIAGMATVTLILRGSSFNRLKQQRVNGVDPTALVKSGVV